jgi:hypothetical protein
MKTGIIKSYFLSNALHLQFVIAVMNLIKKFAHVLSKITAPAEALQVSIDKEDLCYKVVKKSDISALKEECDQARDSIIAGIKDAIKSSLRHFDADVRAAAQRIKIVIDTYDNPVQLAKLHYDAETAAVNNLLQEFNGKYAADVRITGLSAWVEELRIRNQKFEQLANAYNEQQAEKPSARLSNVRKETDKAYQNIITAINGLIVIDGEETYANFVNELNTLIKHYNDLIAQHQGRVHAEIEEKKVEVNDEEKEVKR